MAETEAPSRRERHRQATLAEIVDAARSLLDQPGGLSLRAVAQRVGMTPPALYRYVDDYQALVRLVTRVIDADVAADLRAARDTQPEADPAVQIVRTAVAFRRWALSRPAEFSLVFANPLTSHAALALEDGSVPEDETAVVFTDLLTRLWLHYDFPLPALDDLDPGVAEALADPMLPYPVDKIPESARPLVWVFMQSWMALYGVVTLEVFGHCDPRIIASGAMFRSMLRQQGELLGISHELPRLLPLVDEWLAQGG